MDMKRRAAAILFGSVTLLAGLVPGTQAEPQNATLSGDSARTVTLITGERLTVRTLPNGRHAVTPEPGTEYVGLRMLEVGEDLYVLPAAASPYVPRRLDMELFNVSALIRYGYDDDRASGVPVVVVFDRHADGSPPPGIRKERVLNSIDALAGSFSATSAPEFGHSLQSDAHSALVGIKKIWLDVPGDAGPVQTRAQVDAPSTAAAGADGSGAAADAGTGSYELTVRALDHAGQRVGAWGSVAIMNVEDRSRFFFFGPFDNGEISVRVPPGVYSATATAVSRTLTALAEPEFVVQQDTTVLLDGREAVPINVKSADRDAVRSLVTEVGLHRGPVIGQGLTFMTFMEPGDDIYAVPTTGVTKGTFELYSRFMLEAPPIRMTMASVENERVDVAYLNDSVRFDGEAVLPVVDAGAGTLAELVAANVAGKIALMQRQSGFSAGGAHTAPPISVSQQARNAADAGAAMAIIRGLGPGQGSVSKGTPIPAFSLSQEQGDVLAGRSGESLDVVGHLVSPFLYEVMFPETGRIPPSMDYTVHDVDLARVRQRFDSDTRDRTSFEFRHGFRPYTTFSLALMREHVGPRNRLDLITPGDTVWHQSVSRSDSSFGLTRVTRYEDITEQEERWFGSPVVPGLVIGLDGVARPNVRRGDELSIYLAEYSDTGGHQSFGGEGGDAAHLRLFGDGQLVASTSRTQAVFPLPTHKSVRYRLEAEVARSAGWWPLSTRTETAWEFTSRRPVGNPSTAETVLPMMFAAYDVGADDLGRVVRSEQPHRITVQVGHQAGATASSIGTFHAWWSTDEGSQWTPAVVDRVDGGTFGVSIDPPATAEHVSLRIAAIDAGGNTFEQKILRVYHHGPPVQGEDL